MLIRRLLALATAGSLALAAAALLLIPAAPAAAQEVVQDEGAAYRAWYEANKAGDSAKTLAAAKDYLAKYPTGQYAESTQEVDGLGSDGRPRRGDQGEAHGRHDRRRAADPRGRAGQPQRALRARVQHPAQRAAGLAAQLPERGGGGRVRQQGDRADRGRQDADRRPELRQERDARLADADPRALRAEERQPGKRASSCSRSRPATRRRTRRPRAATCWPRSRCTRPATSRRRRRSTPCPRPTGPPRTSRR